jgi:hypothetical protein
MKRIEFVLNAVYYFIFKADCRTHKYLNKINPFMLLNKLPFQKRKYEREGININQELNRAFNDPQYGISSIRSGAIMTFLSGFVGFSIYCIITSLNKDYLPISYFFVLLLLFASWNYFGVFFKDKYLNYFKIFEARPVQWKKKWALITVFLVSLDILLVIISVYIMTSSLPH